MPAAKDLTGMKFGRLTAMRVAPTKPRKWECLCECGNTSVVITAALINGNTRSCGCLSVDLLIDRLTTHGESGTRLYKCWVSMKKRCENPNDSEYSRYGGRGISVCDEWRDYPAFREWALSHGYCDDLTLERVDVNKGYGPTNCCWIINAAQPFNKTNRRDILRSDGVLFPSVLFAARVTGCHYTSVSNALCGRAKSGGGYGWKYFSDVGVVEPFDVEPDRAKQPVIRSDGEYYESYAKAAAAVGILKSSFRYILIKGNEAKGYTWRLATAEEIRARTSLRAA